MRSVEHRVLDAIDIEGMLGFLGRLVGVRSLGGHETAAQELIAEQMTRSGLDIDWWSIDLVELRRHPSHSEEIERTEAIGLVGRLGPDQPEHSLILNGHVDVVPAGDPERWTYPPWQTTLTDRRVYGRGTADMKGGLCCGLFAIKAIRDAGIELEAPVLVQSVVGEEDGGTGTLASVLRGHTASAAIIMEPTCLDVVTAQAGALNFRLGVSGRAAHGSMRREGISAIDKVLPLLEAMNDLETVRNQQIDHPVMAELDLPYPISIGTLEAGNWASTVPEHLVCQGRYGVAIGESTSAARRAFEAAIARVASSDPWLSQHPPVITWWGGQFEPAETPRDHPIVDVVRQAAAVVCGKVPSIIGAPYGADLRLLVQVGGTPTVLFGPGDVRWAHGTNEFVPIDDLLIAVRTLALTILRYCGIVPR